MHSSSSGWYFKILCASQILLCIGSHGSFLVTMQILTQKNWDGDWESVPLCSYFENGTLRSKTLRDAEWTKHSLHFQRVLRYGEQLTHAFSPVASRVLYKQTTLEDSHSHPGFRGSFHFEWGVDLEQTVIQGSGYARKETHTQKWERRWRI